MKDIYYNIYSIEKYIEDELALRGGGGQMINFAAIFLALFNACLIILRSKWLK